MIKYAIIIYCLLVTTVTCSVLLWVFARDVLWFLVIGSLLLGGLVAWADQEKE